MDELDVALVASQGVNDGVRRVADNSVNLANTDLDHLVNQDFRDRLSHGLCSLTHDG